jgi:hypothetical protein
MAQNKKYSKSADAKQDSPVSGWDETTGADAAAAETAAEPSTGAASIAEIVPEPIAEIVEVVSTPLAALEHAAESAAEAFTASVEFDAARWSKKSLEIWAENASAFLDLAQSFAKAQTFEEFVELQTHFANRRVEAFLRQSNELLELARGAASRSTASFGEFRNAA